MAIILAGGSANPVYLVDVNGNPITPASGGGSQVVSGPLGRQSDAASISVAISTEGEAALAALLTIAAFQARIPTLALGRQADTASLGAALSTEDVAILGATNESAAGSDTATSGHNGLLKRIAQHLTTLEDRVGATDGAAVITDANGAIQQYLRGLVKLWTTGLTAGEAHIGQVGSNATSVDATLTRPNDTTAYAANDEISSSTSSPAVNTITGAARTSGGTLRLESALCVDSANQSTKPQLLVFVFDTTTTPNNDNAAFAPSDSVMNTCVAILPFNIWYSGDDTSGANGNAVSPYLGPEVKIKSSGSANLFFRVKVLNAYTPVANEAFVFRFAFRQD